MTRSEIIKFLILRSIGNFLVLFAIFGVLATFGPALYYELNFRLGQLRGISYEVVEKTRSGQTSGFGEILERQEANARRGFGLSDVLSGEKEKILIPIDTNFDILIPKVGANARVFPNVDPSNSTEFLQVLKKGVAHAKGTVFPGQKGNTYLFAHSVDNFWNVGRYNAVFYLLKNLSPGDEIVVFYQGVRHNYVVSGSKITEASDVSYLIGAQSGEAASAPLGGASGELKEQLVLQTCWPPGTTWKRLLVFAQPKK